MLPNFPKKDAGLATAPVIVQVEPPHNETNQMSTTQELQRSGG